MNREPSHRSQPRNGDLDGAGRQISLAQEVLAGNIIAPADRERVMQDLVRGLEQFSELIGQVSAADMGLGIGGVAAAVQAERQLRAINEQTETLNAGQFAMWRQTMEGRTYLAWEAAASSLIRAVAERDAMVRLALREDLASHPYRAPKIVELTTLNDPVAPKPDAYVVDDPPGCLWSLTGLAAFWLAIEVVIGWFGVGGLLNNWLALVIVIGLAALANLATKKHVDEEKYLNAKLKYEAELKQRAEAADANKLREQQFRADLDSWVRRLHDGMGFLPDAPGFDWVADPADRQAIATVRQFLLDGRRTFPGPESLPSLRMPNAKRASGSDEGTHLNQLLRGFSATSGV